MTAAHITSTSSFLSHLATKGQKVSFTQRLENVRLVYSPKHFLLARFGLLLAENNLHITEREDLPFTPVRATEMCRHPVSGPYGYDCSGPSMIKKPFHGHKN